VRAIDAHVMGYHPVTKALHWLTVVAIGAQFVVGYVMDAGGSGRGRGRGRSGESGRGRGRGGEYDAFGDDTMLTVHVVLGVSILALAAMRLLWRMRSELPPWAPALSSRARTVAHWTERAVYAALFAIPLTGLWLVLDGDDDAVAFHVAAHVVFFVAVATHVAMVLRHRLLPRMI
jgi:cytochrome b561